MRGRFEPQREHLGIRRRGVRAAEGFDAGPEEFAGSLAAVTEPDRLLQAVATPLGLAAESLEELGSGLRDRSMLFVLDNCEHLVDGVADLTWRLLDACPLLRILCTSRERLGITGEVNRPLTGLPVPVSPDVSAAEVRDADAVRLFAERATAVHPAFDLSDAVAQAASEICRRLDGLPLAIELAAARIGTQSAAQIAIAAGMATSNDVETCSAISAPVYAAMPKNAACAIE